MNDWHNETKAKSPKWKLNKEYKSLTDNKIKTKIQ